jgi:hypothetical protein
MEEHANDMEGHINDMGGQWLSFGRAYFSGMIFLSFF